MEQKDFDIYEILKGMPGGTPLYSPLCGNVEFSYLESNKEAGEAIWTEDKNGEYAFDKNGRWMKGGEVLLFPSKEMRDWSKFFKKGDVLDFLGCNGFQYTCTFEKFEDETKKRFIGRFLKDKEVLNPNRSATLLTDNWVKTDDPAEYIRFVEERLGGKLNLETMEIEKPAFEIGKLYVFDEQDEDGNITVIGKLIGKDEIKGTLTFGTQYEIDTENFVTDQTFDLNTSIHKELREATENEVELFNKHYAIWKKEKEAKEQPAFKPFDKVLVRSGRGYNWYPALFVSDRGENVSDRYIALSIYIGTTADFTSCIKYEGHENIAFTNYDIENLPF